MTMNDTWGFKEDDRNWKSADTLIRMLVDAASKGGNFLLNVGPDGRGRIPHESAERLDAIGRWLQPRGEAIYGTQASPFGALPWGRCTQRALDGGSGTRLYLFVFDRPRDGRLRLPGLVSDATHAFVLGTEPRVPLDTARDEDAIVVTMPADRSVGPCAVISLDLRGPALVVAPPTITAPSTTFVGTARVEVGGAAPGEIIRYTLDGREPSAVSPEAQGSITIDRSCTVSARIFDGDAPRSGTAVRTFTRATPRLAVDRPVGPSPGWRATLFERDRFQRIGDLNGATISGSLVVPSLSLDRRPRDEHFAMVFEGFVRVPREGVWRFWLECDDGAVLRIGDSVVVDNDGLHEARWRDGEVALAAGLHAIRVEYFNAGGARTLSLDWEGPGIARQRLPDAAIAWPQ